MSPKIDQLNGQELGKKLSAFKIRFLKNRHLFKGSHYKMINAVHITTKWKDQNMIFARLRFFFNSSGFEGMFPSSGLLQVYF